MSPAPVTPEIVAMRASKRMNRDLSDWLLGESIALSIPLHPPTGKEAAADMPAAQQFIAAWHDYPVSETSYVNWESRSWHAASLGNQRVPARFTATGAEAIARAAGRLSEWVELQRRFHLLIDALLPNARESAARHVKSWRALDDAELLRISALTAWFVEHPNSGLLPRAVAVEGVHGKWLEQHRPLVEALVSATRGYSDGGPSGLGLGIIEPTIRLRRLDPQLHGSEGLEDISVPLTTAAQLFSTGPQPTKILMVENLATFLSIPPTTPGSGAVVLWTKGYAVDLVARLPWIHAAELIYWGDLDSDGFAILHQLRSALPHNISATSVLMDTATVTAYSHLGVPDPGDVGRILSQITPAEQQSRDLLITKGPLRIEQERIAWPYALAQLAEAGFAIQGS